METRAPHALVGLFVLAAICAAFGFAFWINNTGGLAERAVYRVRFENTVSGLLGGAAVLFNGIRVGEVTGLGLNSDNPREITATISVLASTPIRADTQAGLEFQGLTGVPVIALQGGSREAPSLVETKGLPLITADASASQSVTETARQALRQLDALMADNSENLKSAIANLNTFTGALARNSDRVDSIVSGLERMMGATGPKPVPAIYDLIAPTTFPPTEKHSTSQLVVVEPTAAVTLDTQRIVVASEAGQGPSIEEAQWSDTIPKMLQAKIIQSFENSNYFGAVARPMDGLTPDYQLLVDIHSFQIEAPSAAADKSLAHVAFAAKIVGDKGRIVASRTFDAHAAATNVTAAGSAAALDEAFQEAVKQLAAWAAGAV